MTGITADEVRTIVREEIEEHDRRGAAFLLASHQQRLEKYAPTEETGPIAREIYEIMKGSV